MGEHEEKIEIMRKYLADMTAAGNYHVKGNIHSKKIDNALQSFAQGMDRTTMLGFLDTTEFGSGKNGYIFTDDKMYYVETMEKPKKLWYDDIKQLRILKSSKKDCNRELAIDFLDGSTFYIEGSFINKTPLKNFLNEMKNFEANKKAEKKKIENEKKNNFGAESAGRGIGAFRTVNNQFEEEKFHSRQGHGFAAERANNLFDKLTGHDAKEFQDDKGNGKYQLDLWKANEIILTEAGILPENLDITDICTCCNPDLLFSHRACHGKRGNLAAFIVL